MKDNIDVALREELTTLREKEKKMNSYPLSVELLTANDVGKLAKCFIQDDRKWKNSIVMEVDVEEQTAKVKRYGSTEILELEAYLLKVLKEPDSELFK
jgi:predicted polyphosphate/ATP-dependent NAD kinase